MTLGPFFKLREEPTEEIISLLENTTLGTNGAQYRHLDTRQRIQEADQPLFLSLERHEKVLGNVTFCRRGPSWYIRYFAFDTAIQTSNNRKRENKGSSVLKKQLSTFFDEVLEDNSFGAVDSLYAYIEPRNDRSKWMSQNFGFQKIATLNTQTFSRVKPEFSSRLEMLNDTTEMLPLLNQTYASHRYYFNHFLTKPPYYVLRNHQGELIAAARFTKVHWEIVRLPGKMGCLLTRLIPYIPLINRLIRPKNHHFLVPDGVVLKDHDPKVLEELFSAVLYKEKRNVILWWMDADDTLFLSLKKKVRWGLLHHVVGTTPVDVMECRSRNSSPKTGPVFVTAFDMV
jgi:L-amino acid N-acyltransferase YncA